MNYWLILALAAALPWGVVAQDTSQQQLPNAPSAVRYPPQPDRAPVTVQPEPAPQTQVPASPQQGSGSTTGQQSGSQPATKSDAPPSTSAKPVAGSGDVDDTLTVIRKRVDEVNVVFTVTDKREHFVKDLTQNDFRVVDDNKPAKHSSTSAARPTCRCASAC